MSARVNPITSHEAYASLKQRDIAEIYKKIIGAIRVLNIASSEQIATHLNIDHAKVWKRMNELCADGKIWNTKKKTVNKSGRQAFMYSLTGQGLPEITQPEHHYKKSEKSAGTIASNIIDITQLNLFDK